MSTTLAVNCAPILVCSKDDGKTAAETASDEMVIRAVRGLSESSLLVTQENHSDLSLKALDDALKQFYQKKGVFREQKMLKSAKAKVDDMVATESYQLREQKIHKICAAMETLVYGAEKVSSTKRMQFHVHLNRSWQAATTWSDADCQKAIERLELQMHQETPDKSKLFEKLYQRHDRQLSQQVGTKATGPRSKFSKEPALMTTAAEDEAWGAANMIADKGLQFQICLSDAETEAMTWCLADTEHVTIRLDREIYGIISNEQHRFMEEFSIRLIEFEAWWGTIGIQALRKTIEQLITDFGYPMMHVVSHISDSIHGMGSADNFTTDIPERLHIANVKETYQSSNKVNYIPQMLHHNDRVPVLTIRRRHSHMLHAEAGTMSTRQKLSTYCPQPINGEVHAEPICYVSNQFRTSHSSALYHSRYII